MRIPLVAVLLILGLAALAAYLGVNYANPQWHWRLYAHQAKNAPDNLLEPGPGYSGEWNNWTQDGRLRSTYAYRNGKRDGHYTTYDSLGGVLSQGQYADGKLDGVQKITQEGGARTEIPYRDGKRNGVETTWYPNGNVAVEAPWADDAQEGPVTFYYESGMVQASIPFYRGKIEGVQKTWYENGAIQGEETYRDNLKDGPSVFRHPDGGKDMELQYRNDRMDGLQTWYFPDGGKAREIELAQGEPHGVWREWDEEGNLIVDDIYERGELKKKAEEPPPAAAAPTEPEE